MASVPRSRRPTEPRSGGKIVRARKPAGGRTPYDRPKLSNLGPQNPNWLARFVFPPTRLIATGAGKLLSTVFGPESSSSSSSSSGGDSSSEDDVDDDNNDDDISSQRAEGLEKNGTSETIKFFKKGPLPTVGSSETKRLIEQLLLRETYSREECDRLTSIIKSRVVDYPVTDDAENGRQDIEAPALCGTAVGEAKKWLEEKKLGSNSKSELGHGTHRLNSVELSHATDGEVGSPVDMAKSYMRARPAWASPSTKHIEFKSKSPVGIPLFKEETPYSIGCNSTSSSKLKRDSPTTGSWNIQEEIRKVRSKATEEMLRTLPSTKIDWSSFGLDYKSSQNSLVMDRLETGMGDKTYDSTKSVDASSNLASLSAPSVLEMSQAGMQNEVTPPNPADFISGHNQDVEDIRSIKGKGDLADGSEEMLSSGHRLHSSEVIKTVSYSDAGAVDGFKDTNGTDHQLGSMGGTTQDSRLHDGKFPTSDNAAGMGVACTANGFPTPGSSLPARLDTEQDAKAAKSPDEEQNSVSSSHNKITTTADVETCELLSEASMEVPNVNETESAANGSQNSSSMHGEELSQDLTQPKRGLSLAGKTSSIVEEKQGRKPSSRPNRRGRGRGK